MIAVLGLLIFSVYAAAGPNANAVLSLDLIADGGAGNGTDDRVTSGTVSGRGTTIAIEIFATGVRTSLIGVTLEFDFDSSLLSFVEAENSAFSLTLPEGSTGTNFGTRNPVTLASSGFLARAEFTTVSDVTGTEFSIGIESVTLAENTTSSDELITTSVITFNASPSPDFDGDDWVGFSDFLIFAQVFGSERGDGTYDARIDLNSDGSIGFTDFLIFAQSFGSAPPSTGGGNPDLVVQSPSVSDNNVASGATFTLGATVRNQGDGSSAATTLHYYRSDDETVSTSDTEVGTDAVRGLAAGRASAESIDLAGPSDAGTYYYSACVDAVTGESDTGNNCSAAVSIAVAAVTPPGAGGANRMYWTNAGRDKIQRSNLDGSGVEDLVTTGLSSPYGIALDVSGGKMYWTDRDTDKIQRSNLDGSGVEDLVTTGLEDPHGIALDVAGGKMYWTDYGTEKIQRSNLDGSGVEDLVTTGLVIPFGIALDVDGGKMYWTDWGTDKIQRSNLDGSGVEDLVTTGLQYPFGIALDVSGGKMYWTDWGTDKIQRSNLDGSGVEDLVTTGLQYPDGIALDVSGGKMYWTDWGTAKIQRSNLDGSGVEDLVTTGLVVTRGIALSFAYAEAGKDLGVRASVSDNTLTPGQSFTLSATVRNRGTEQTAATTLRYYRSSNATISSSDTEVGTDGVSSLPAGDTSAESISLTAPSEAGTYYYGACVDPVTGESDTGNNCSSAVTVTVGAAPAPDLVVDAPSVSNSSPTAGASFTLSATVRNQGAARSGSTTLRYYRSDDATIDATDTEVGTDAVRGLAAGGASDESISLTAPSSAGTYYYGACVESVSGESDTGNNCSSGVTVTVSGTPPPSGSPDLIVESPSVNDNTLTTGQSFTLRATVRNQGNASSASTTLRYYRSSASSDAEVGTDGVSSLPAGDTSAESTNLTAPSEAGTYYYAACVDPVTGESDTGNNCSSAVTVTVTVSGTPPSGSPDLIVESPSVNDNTLTTGQSFNLEAIVRNQGTGSSAATTLRYYLSTDATVSTSDTQVGTDLVSSLYASRTSSESISLRAPSSAGTYYYGACVESVSDETDTGNNCSSAVTVTVGAAPAPDLVVDAPTVSTSSPTGGASFTLRATVRNQGTGRSGLTTLRYYLSTDATVSTSDTEVGTDLVSSLSASRTSSESIFLSAPSNAGTYYYGACVESVSDETDTGNNCSSAVTVTVGAAPDLVVDAPTVSTSFPTAGASFTLNATVRNQGNGESAATTLRFYRSTDVTISTSDTEVGSYAVGAMSASGTSDHSTDLTAPSSAGFYYYGACVESVSDETDTGNNCSLARTVSVGAAPAPNLWLLSPSVSTSSPTTGASFTLSVTVLNTGTGPSAATTLRFYRSDDATISDGDTEVGSQDVGGLAASGRSDHSTDLAASSSVGTYYYGACVDAVPGESDAGNNCTPAVTVTVGAAPAPDLVVGSPSVSNDSPTAGASFTLNATVRNQGNGQSAATTLRFYRSTDATISASDTEVGSDAVSGLSASGTSDHSTELTAPSNEGYYYYGACVESVSDETDTGNNCSLAVLVYVRAPDLVVDWRSVSDHSPTAGASFSLSVTVRNQGTSQSAATTLRFFRSTDETISASDTEVGADAVSGLAASGTSDNSIDLTAPSSAGTYYYGACVESVNDESNTGNNCSAAWTVYVGAAPAPDLVVGTPQAPSNPTAGTSFTLSATVRNQGNGQSAATTLRFYRSTDATISASDTEVGSIDVGGLSASGTSDHSIDLTAPSSAGTYYYGACVESVSNETDTGNNCSLAAPVTVAPDLVVDFRSISDSSPTAGASFTLSATVRNQGTSQSAATTLRFYRSTDATISASDTEVGSDAVSGLSASGTSDHSTDLTAPSSAGTYYYGACVESVSDETDTGNNCSPAVTVTVVAAPEPDLPDLPDLVVDSPTVSNSNPAAGTFLTLSATIRNQGKGQSAATTLRFYRSTDATISASDTEVGSRDVSGLAASVSVRLFIDHHAPSSAGTYYYGACVESVSGESDTGNNCSPAVTVTVTQAWKLYWTDLGTDKIQGSNLDGSGVEDLVTTGLEGPWGIALDVSGGKLYWTDANTDKIQRSNLDGSGVEDLVTGLDYPLGIALDVSGGKMYWTHRDRNTGKQKIQRSNLDGSGVEDLVTTGGWSWNLDGIALDVSGGKMYWTHGDRNTATGKIQRSNLNGSGVEDLVTTGGWSPNVGGIALDVSGGKMYWTHRGIGTATGKIQRSNLDGSGVEDLVTTGSTYYPVGIALDVTGGKMYWTDVRAPQIRRSNLDGSDVEGLVTGLRNAYGIALGLVPVEAGTD